MLLILFLINRNSVTVHSSPIAAEPIYIYIYIYIYIVVYTRADTRVFCKRLLYLLTHWPVFTCMEIRLRLTANQIFKQGILFVFEYAINKTYEKMSRHNCINNLSSATSFAFICHLQAEHTIVIWTVHYSAVSGLDEISAYIIIEYYKK
jgi:hypothetical protein